jgi:hypothetical protein
MLVVGWLIARYARSTESPDGWLKSGAMWVYLAAEPLLWLTVTLAIFVAGTWLNRRLGGHPLVASRCWLRCWR